MDPLLWSRFRDVNRHVWRVWLAVVDQTEYLEEKGNPRGLCGVTIVSTRDIYVNAAYPKRVQIQSLLHELGHAAVEASNERIPLEQEERVMYAIDRPLAHALTALGMRWPPWPRNWRALRTYQREAQ